MNIANKPLNLQALALEEAETEIRETVKNEYIKQTSKTAINKKIHGIIQKAIDKLSIRDLKKAAVVSLLDFYEKQYAEISRLNGATLGVLVALKRLSIDNTKSDKGAILPSNFIRTKQEARLYLENYGVEPAKLYGSPLKKFSQDYIRNNVKPVLDRLAKQFPLDPDNLSGRKNYASLRNRAEMEARYDDHLKSIEDLKSKGTKLVICSTHADCSDRCAPWQGRVFSLDGTSGVTDDGRKYVPLETATKSEEVKYVTRTGKVYYNGLLGFNCRHYLVPYKTGYRFPQPSAKTERKEYAITKKQRELERQVIKWKTVAVSNKNVDEKQYLMARKKATEWNKAYIEFSERNNRAYYPSRTKII